MSDEESDVIEVVMMGVLRPSFERWLASRGLELHRAPFLDDESAEHLPIYVVTPSDELMEQVRDRSN